MQITDNNESALYVLNYTTEGENLMNLSYKIHDISDFMVSATPEAQIPVKICLTRILTHAGAAIMTEHTQYSIWANQSA